MMSKNRKLDEEIRAFNTEKELGFFFMFTKDKTMCLLCNMVLTNLKKFNATLFHYLILTQEKILLKYGKLHWSIQVGVFFFVLEVHVVLNQHFHI